jgi:hypothetical protein
MIKEIKSNSPSPNDDFIELNDFNDEPSHIVENDAGDNSSITLTISSGSGLPSAGSNLLSMASKSSWNRFML